MKDYHRHSKAVTKDRRWPALRLLAKRRDDFRCVSCGARGRLEVDHIKPVRDAPELAFELDNLQTLCVGCHSRKTLQDIGLQTPITNRKQWIESIESLMKGSRHADFAEDRTPPVGDSPATGKPRWY